MPKQRATIDFETRSACDLPRCGAWRYSVDPTTEILCLAFRLPSWGAGRTGLWTPADGNPPTDVDADLRELLIWIRCGRQMEAHNAWFERCIWANILVERFGFPAARERSWRCSAAKAAVHALPRGLDEALAALGLKERKDAAGSKVMKKMISRASRARRNAKLASRGCCGGIRLT